MKKIILLLAIAFSLCAINKASAQVVASGTTGDCTWTVTGTEGDYTLTISGTGAMGDYYSWAGTPWVNYNFRDNYSYSDGIKTLDIQQGVTTIGEHAFDNCSGLTSVTIGPSVTVIKAMAFCDCTGLMSVAMGSSVTTIASGAFMDCFGLTSVSIGNSVTSIDDSAFDYCYDLISIDVDVNNTHYSSIDGVLFNKSRDTLILYPAGKPETDYTVPNSVTTIGWGAFRYCSGLMSVVIGSSVTTIEERAFEKSENLTSVTIGPSVTTIEEGTFEGCTGLTELYVRAQTPPALGSDVFDKVPATIPVHVPSGTASTYRSTPGWDYFSNYIDDIHLSILPVENEDTVSVSPNPVREVLYVQSAVEVEQISIHNTSGQPVKQITNPSREVEVNDLSNGLYLIKIKIPAGEVVKKIVKE